MYSITSRKVIKKGISGGISVVGTLSALIGCFIYAACVNIIMSYENTSNYFIIGMIIMTITGWTGMLLDSFIGSIFQKKYYCNICRSYVDEAVCCNVSAVYIKRKYQILDNNATNFVTGCIVGLVLSIIYG